MSINYMTIKISFLCGPKITMWTLEWLLSSVSTDVTSKKSRSTKVLATETTDMVTTSVTLDHIKSSLVLWLATSTSSHREMGRSCSRRSQR